MAPGALIIGGDYRGLGVVRSLGRRGIPVWVLTDDHLVAGTSRYARRHFPWPAAGEASRLEFLLQLGAEHALEGWTLFPTGDETAALLARHHAELISRFRLTVPPWDRLRWAYDKRLSYELAARVGVDYPWTRYPACLQEAAALECTFPVILKPAFKEGLNDLTHAKAWRVDCRKQLVKAYAGARRLVSPEAVMVQELIPGGGETQVSYAALCEEGRPLASMTARRTRQFPLDFGRASTFVEAVDLPEIEEPARRLLLAMGYTGLIEVEFKYDARDGRFKLLDMNPRVWGWHTLGRRAGVDFPYLLWQLVHGEPVPAPRVACGARWVRLSTDLAAAAHAIRQGRLSLKAYLQSFRGPLEFALFSPDDPVPALLDIPLLCYLGWKRRRTGSEP